MIDKKYNLAGNCVHGLDDPYFRNTVCSDATEMAGIVDEDMNKFLLGDDFVQSVNWSYDLMGLPSDNIYEFAYNPYKDIYWAYNIEDDVHFFFVRDSINENYKDTITVKTIKLSDILEEMLSEPEGKYVYIGTCMDSFDEYGECIHNAFYDEEHFFNSWQNANEISKEEFWSNINPLSDKYDEVKELESDPEYPAEYRYNPDDDIYFIFVGNDTHYFFVSPDSYENTKDTEDEDYYDINIQENISRIKDIMGLFRKPKEVDPQEEDRRFTCADCGNPDYNMYMVNDNIWNEYGNKRETLCKSCLEKRMDRNLTSDDFSQHRDALVNKHNPEVQDLFK